MFFNVKFFYLIKQIFSFILFSKDYPQKKNDSLTKEMVFDVIYYIYPPKATGLETSRKSTWIRPIIDGEDETAIQGLNIIFKRNLLLIYIYFFRNTFLRTN